MSSPSLRLSPTLILAPLTDSQGKLNYQWQDFFRKLVASQNVVNETFDQTNVFQGPVGQQATLDVRGIPLATLLQFIDDGGIVLAGGIDFTRAYLNKNIGNIPDAGPGFPLAGGAAAYLALVTSGPTAGQVLGWNGVKWVPMSLAAGGVTQILAGANVSISPLGGTGVVTINAISKPAGVPTVAAGAGAGGGATAGFGAGANDLRGVVTLVAGTAPGAGTLLTVTLSAALGAVPSIVFSPTSPEAALQAGAAGIWAGPLDTQHWTIIANGAIATPGTYDFSYIVME
jgi:hypothetical protein